MEYEILIVNDSSAGEMMDKCYESTYNVHHYSKYIVDNKKFPETKPPIWIKLYKEKEFNSLNDFVHSLYNFIINDKVKAILDKHKLPNHDYLPAQVFRKEKTLLFKKLVGYNYYWFNYDCEHISDYYEHIDFEKSEITFFRNEKNIDLKINSISDLHSIRASNKLISNEINELYKLYPNKQSLIQKFIKEKDLFTVSWRTEKIVLKDSFDIELDLFSLPLFSFKTYVSPRLKKALIDENIKDIFFKKTGNNPDPRYLINPQIKLENPKIEINGSH
ncbi:hypothetical protein FEDK69T_30260 [Flavobacterium enshiense DK69]|uniref:hypothetical protein n=1 Tax=Flavobacterium enshiense TaxID=1341165 RepID=UPI0003C60B46|nr:hypothetical protein [Flavobacterium enshiense]ESU20211.1 hypothetical protein FEDK69T_30260 [Flavobacterium enshiense DK69]